MRIKFKTLLVLTKKHAVNFKDVIFYGTHTVATVCKSEESTFSLVHYMIFYSCTKPSTVICSL